MGEVAFKDPAEHTDFGVGSDHKTIHAPEQAHHHRHQGDQAECLDQ